MEADRFDALLTLSASGDRICPVPISWDQWHTCSPSGLDWNYGHAIAEDERKRDKSKD